jgi:hypothetical protein
VRRWELWEKDWDRGGSQSFFPEENQQAREMAQEDGQVFVWDVTARGYNDAMRGMYQFRAWGEYTPILLQADGTPMPEDEDDDYEEPGGTS